MIKDGRIEGARWRASSNREPGLRPRLLVLHYTGGSLASALDWLTNEASDVSAHFVISRHGEVTQLVRTDEIAWHCGVSAWVIDGKEVRGLNRYAIGIELANFGRVSAIYPARHECVLVDGVWWHNFPSVQITATMALALELVREYSLEPVRHSDISPGRKIDPGPAFRWETFVKAVMA